MLYEDQTIKITDSCDVGMIAKSVVSITTIVGFNRYHRPRHGIKEDLDVSLGYTGFQRWLPHIAKVDAV
ncbi:hypothetical protein TNCV_4729391 [Trichonephila clavipes]|nr:hypothetical protein TNCV_4729391 [Trichonephila clavipes]